MGKTSKVIEYRDCCYEYNFYGQGEYTVQYCGDDVMFKTEEEVRKFIDEVVYEE